MSGLVFVPIGDAAHIGDSLVILDVDRRLYAGLSKERDYWHVVEPLQVDQVDGDGNVVRRAGELGCRCKGAIFHGRCYRVAEATAWEHADHEGLRRPEWLGPDPRGELALGLATFDAPAGAGEAVEASRG